MLLTLLIVAFGFSTVIGAVNLYYIMPMNVTVEESASLSFYIEGAAWINNTDVTFGTQAPGSVNPMDFDVKNTGNVAAQVIFYVSGLPSTFDITYSRNGSVVQPGNWLNGTITLTLPGTVTPASYYFTGTVYIS